jgi:uncharacterized membrane protein
VLDDVADVVVVVVDALVVVGTVVVVVGVVVVRGAVVVVVVVGKLGAHMASMRWANLEAHIGAEDAPGARHMAATR